MRKYEKKEVTVIKETLVKIVCDVCNKEIDANEEYYGIVRGHNDWGNDSVDSVECKDACSDACLQKEFNEYLEYDSDTKFIEVHKEQNKEMIN